MKFRRSSEPEPTVTKEKPMPDLNDVTDALDATQRWLRSTDLPACQVAVDRDGGVELTWHSADAETTRKVVSALPGHWEVKTAGFVFLRTFVEIDADSVHHEIRRIECTIFPDDDADISSLITVSA